MEVYAVQDFRDALYLVDDELGGMLAMKSAPSDSAALCPPGASRLTYP